MWLRWFGLAGDGNRESCIWSIWRCCHRQRYLGMKAIQGISVQEYHPTIMKYALDPMADGCARVIPYLSSSDKDLAVGGPA